MADLTKRQAPQPIKPDPMMSATSLSALIWVLIVLCLAFVMLRTWVQFRKTKRLFPNDYFIFFAMTCHVATAACCQAAISPTFEMAKYYGESMKPPSNFAHQTTLFLRLKFTVAFLLWTTLWSVKFSLLFFFWRLFDSVRSKGKWFWWLMCFVTAATYIIAVILQFLSCDPFENFFRLDKCTNTGKDRYHINLAFRFAAGADIGVDFLIVLIPFPLLWKLHVSFRQKWVLAANFLLPVIPIAFGIVRLVICDPGNTIVDPVKFQVYSMLENSAAIITSCIPSLILFVKDSRHSSKGSDPTAKGNTHDRPSAHNVEIGTMSFSMISESHQEDDIDTEKTTDPQTRSLSTINRSSSSTVTCGSDISSTITKTGGPFDYSRS